MNILTIKILGKATLAIDATAEGNGAELALQVVSPLMIWTDKIGRIALTLTAEQHASVHTSIDEGMKRVVIVAAN